MVQHVCGGQGETYERWLSLSMWAHLAAGASASSH